MPAYYNEIDPYAAQWLRNLIAKGLIPAGDVDERSIVDVQPDDIAGYRQCHFFAGIGGWALAARLAGWPEDRELWTGSCPCQPFSSAARGRNKGIECEKHLWPEWRRLISACRPAAIFGEQVAHARAWLDGVCDDMEADNYTIAAIVLPAYCAGKDHARERIYFACHPNGDRKPRLSEHAKVGRMPWSHRVSGGILPPDGLSAVVDKRRACKGFGNAIVPQVAAQFVASYLEIEQQLKATA